LAALTLYATDM